MKKQKPLKAKVKKRRTVLSYAEFWHTANMLIESGNEVPQGSSHAFRAALIFQAFTLEAALNHIGNIVYKSWPQIERQLGPEKKIILISEKLELTQDYSKPPWQIVGELLAYRNALAHGKTEVVEAAYEEEVRDYMDKRFFEFAPTKWESFATKQNALKVKKDLRIIIESLYKAAEIEGQHPFMMGMQEATSSVIND